jgi:hypothetical protein
LEESLPWLTAMTFWLLSISLVSLLIDRMSQPVSRGGWLNPDEHHNLVKILVYHCCSDDLPFMSDAKASHCYLD